MHLKRRHIALAAVALLGIAAPAALTMTIARLAGQHIGLTAQPLSVIRGLAPTRREDLGSAERVSVSVRTHTGRRRTHAARIPAAADAPTTPSSSAPSTSAPATGATATSASTLPPSPSPASTTGTTTRSQQSGRHQGDDSNGGSSSGPDD